MKGPVYNLDDFLNDAKNNPANILIEQQAEENAKQLGLHSSAEIRDYLKELKKDDCEYVNTLSYRKHPQKPYVDGYKIKEEYRHPYLAFYKLAFWGVKSLHTSDEHHDSPFAGLKKQLLKQRVKI